MLKRMKKGKPYDKLQVHKSSCRMTDKQKRCHSEKIWEATNQCNIPFLKKKKKVKMKSLSYSYAFPSFFSLLCLFLGLSSIFLCFSRTEDLPSEIANESQLFKGNKPVVWKTFSKEKEPGALASLHETTSRKVMKKEFHKKNLGLYMLNRAINRMGYSNRC